MILSSKQWTNDIVVTKRTMPNGEVIYFPRNQRAQQKLYKIDSILCGFKENIHKLPKGTIVVNPNDEIIQ